MQPPSNWNHKRHLPIYMGLKAGDIKELSKDIPNASETFKCHVRQKATGDSSHVVTVGILCANNSVYKQE